MKRFSNIISALILVLLLNVTSALAAPSRQARYIAFTDITSNSAKITWINGNGGNRIVVMYNNNNTPGNPVNGTNYSASAVYGSGAEIVNGGTTGYVVYSGGGSTRSVTVSNLSTGSSYLVMVYEYNNIPTNFDFNTNSATNNPRSLKTAIAVPTGLVTSNVGANTATTTWGTVSGATGYEFLLTQGGNPVPEYNKIDIGNVITYDLTYLTKSTTYNWTVAAYNADDQSANAAAVVFTTLNDVTPPTFTVKYFSDASYTNEISLPVTQGIGTYYLQVTSDEPLNGTPTVTIEAYDGTANDKSNVATNQIDDFKFGYTRDVEFDNLSDDGMTAETISVTGTDLNSNTGTTNDLNGINIDTKSPEFSDVEFLDNYTMNVFFTEEVQTLMSGPLTADNFVITLVNGAGSGVSDVSISDFDFQGGIYTLEFSYTAEDYFGAPYAGNPGITVSVVDVKDMYGNEFDESYTTDMFDLLLTPIKNVTQNYFYETLLDAADVNGGIDDEDDLVLAPTTIYSYDAVTFDKSVNITGDADVILMLSDALTFDGMNSFSTIIGEMTISEDAVALSTAGITNSSSYLYIDGLTFSGFTGDAIKNNSGTLDVVSSTFTGNNVGIRVINGTDIYVSSSTFNTNTNSIVVNNTFNGSTIAVYDNKFGANPAIANNATIFVNAVSNFYNSANGPTKTVAPNINPCGNGSLITGNVDYEPWYLDNTLMSTASNVTDNVIYPFSTQDEEYCAYPDSETNIYGSDPMGGDGSYTYIWFIDDVEINGETSKDLLNYSLDMSGVYEIYREVTSNNCSYSSDIVTITVNELPTVPMLSTTSTMMNFCFGTDITIQVDNIETVSYQWFDGDDQQLNNETFPTLTVDQSGTYYVISTNMKGCEAISEGMIVNELAELTLSINNGDMDYTSCLNEVVELSTSVSPADSYTYQWYMNGIMIDGATNSTYEPNMVGMNDEYSVEATNITKTPNCSITDDINVTIYDLPNVPTITGDNTICFDESNMLTISNIESNIDYQWYMDDNMMIGETAATLTVNATGTYTVTATNTNSCVVESMDFDATVLDAFTVTVDNVNYCSNVTAIDLVADVASTNQDYTYTYQWYENNMMIMGATSSTYTRMNDAPGIYTYNVEVTLSSDNEGCEVASNDATITIYEIATPSVSGNQLVCENSAIALSSANSNMDATVASYQWFLNDMMIMGATSSTYDKANTVLADQGNYSVEMTTDNGCMTTSSDYYVEISELAKINNFAFDNTITNGDITMDAQATSFREDLSVTYTLTADSATSYKWYFDGDEIMNETSNTLTLDYTSIANLFNGLDEDIFTSTFPVYAEAVSANSCANAMSFITNLTVVPLPTKLEIVDISNPLFNGAAKMETGVSYNVTVKTRNNLNVLSPVTMNTGLSITINNATVTMVVNNGSPVTVNENTNTVTFPVTLTKSVGAVELQLTAATTSGMTLTSDATANFVLVPALPAPPTNLRRTSRSRTTLSMAWNITNTSHNSLLLAKVGTYAGAVGDKPADETAYVGDNNFGNANSLGDYKVLYSGNARTVTLTSLTRATPYNIKAFAVAGDFASGREATIRYSVETENTTTSQQATSNKDGEEFFETQGSGSFSVETIFPNPVKDVLNFNIVNELAGEFKVEVMTVTGQIVSVPFSSLNLGIGSFNYNFDVNGLAAGSYMLIVTSNDHAHVVPFVIMK